MRKTLIGALASILLLAGLSGPALAQDPTPTPDPAATATPDPAVTPDPAATVTPDPDPAATATPTDAAEAFATGTPNPQPAQPLTAPTAEAAPAATDEVLGQAELAFTGPDTRVAGLAMALLGAGASCIVGSRRRNRRLLSE